MRVIDSSDSVVRSIGDIIIERVPHYKYIGIWIDKQLFLQVHIDTLVFVFRNKSSFPFLQKTNC